MGEPRPAALPSPSFERPRLAELNWVKAMAGLFIIASVVLLAGSFSLYRNATEALSESRMRLAEAALKHLAEASARAMVERDYARLELYARQLAGRDDVAFVRIGDASGRVMLDLSYDPEEQRFSTRYTQLRMEIPHLLLKQSTTPEGQLVFLRQVVLGGETLGAIEVGLTEPVSDRLLGTQLAIVPSIIVVVVLIWIFFAYFVFRNFRRGVAEIDTARQFAQIYLEQGSGLHCVTDEAFHILIVSDEFAAFFKRRMEYFIGRPMREVLNLGEASDERDIQARLAALGPGEVYRDEAPVRITLHDGSVRYIIETSKWLPGLSPGTRLLSVSLIDVTDLEAAQERLRQLAYRDEMTGLLSRRGMRRLLGDGMRDSEFATFIIDVDYFKPVNDAFGHDVGDALLTAIGKAIQKTMAASGYAVRLGGEEFAAFARWEGWEAAARQARSLQDAIRNATVPVSGGEISRTASIGVSRLRPDEPLTEALTWADRAMAEVKQRGRNGIELATAEFISGKLEGGAGITEKDVIRALQNHEIHYFVQPIWNARDKALVGFEALIRWKRSDAEFFYPRHFLEAFLKVIHQAPFEHYRRTLIGEALQSLNGFPEAYVAFNIGIETLAFEGAADQVSEEFRVCAGCESRTIVLEISESAIGQRIDFGQVAREILVLKSRGFKIALDDFGKESSNIHRLTELPVDIVKLDRFLINSVDLDPKARSIVRMIGELAEPLGVSIVAEGVETREQAQTLLELGVEVHQGYLYSMAVHPDNFAAHVPDEGLAWVVGST